MSNEEVNAGEEVEVNPLTQEETPIEGEAKTGEESPTSVEAQEERPINQEAVQERFNKITAEKYEEKRRADELERQLKELQGKQDTTPSEAPTLEQFDYDEEKYTSALMDYKIAQTLKDQARINEQQLVESKREGIAKDFFAKEAEYIAQHPEYREAVSKLPLFKPETLDAIYELGPEMSSYLSQHLDVADAIASVSPVTAGVKLGQIAAKLSVKKPEVKPSNAPDPVTTLNGGAAVNKSMEDMSMEEIMSL
jgi:hypothetical protein